MPSEPPRPGAEDSGHDRTGSGPQRPLSRDDLFGPGGPFTRPGRPEDEPEDGPDEATVAWAPGEEATVAYRPGEAAPEQTRAYRPQPEITPPTYPQPGPYQPSYDEGYQQGGYTPGQYQPAGYQQPGYPAGGYEPGQYQPGDPRNPYGDPYGGYGPGGPGGPPAKNRAAVLVALLVLAVGVVAAGVIYVVLGDDPDTTTATPGTSATPGAQATTPAGGDEEPSPAPSEKETDPADYEPIPDQPWTDDALDFGLLTAVKKSGDEVRITVNRATFLYGDEAREKNGGEAPENDYLIEDTNPRLRTFVLRPDSPINGADRLAGAGSEGKDLDLDEFVEAAQKTLAENRDNDGGVPVWLRHEGNEEDGPVTAVKEQFLP